MQCPFCGQDNDKVIDSRGSEGGRVVRRRRECIACKRRYTTYERPEETIRLTVVKKDGSREPYQRDKIIEGLRRACEALERAAMKLGELDAILGGVELLMTRRQDLRAVQGDVPLGVSGGTKHLEIDGCTHDLRLRRCTGRRRESQQGQADRGLSGIHVFLRRVGG